MSAPRGKEIGKPKPGSCGQGGEGGGGVRKMWMSASKFSFFCYLEILSVQYEFNLCEYSTLDKISNLYFMGCQLE